MSTHEPGQRDGRLDESYAEPSPLTQTSRAIAAIYKEQLGRGPRLVHSHWSGPDAVVCLIEGTLTPIERMLADSGERRELQNLRQMFQAAARTQFVTEVERIMGRPVVSFLSGNDVEHDTACEVFMFERAAADGT